METIALLTKEQCDRLSGWLLNEATQQELDTIAYYSGYSYNNPSESVKADDLAYYLEDNTEYSLHELLWDSGINEAVITEMLYKN